LVELSDRLTYVVAAKLISDSIEYINKANSKPAGIFECMKIQQAYLIYIISVNP
jgi:hypothetical protein